MRPDMDKVIVERPRVGSRLNNDDQGALKLLQKSRHDSDLLPRRASTSRHRRRQYKNLNEHLGPLRRFLNTRVGQNWNKVHAEIRSRINPNSAVQMHILQHLLGRHAYVETQVKAWPDAHSLIFRASRSTRAGSSTPKPAPSREI